MKKTVIIRVLLVCICIMLWGCGKSEAVKNVESLIEEIGEVTVDSGNSIEEAENAYNALTDEEKKQVENAELLTTKKEELAACIEKAEEEARKKEEEEKKKAEEERKKKLAPFVGTWKPIYADAMKNEFYHDLMWDLQEQVPKAEKVIDENDEFAEVNEDGTIECGMPRKKYKLVEDNGITKLVGSSAVYVREEDYEDVMDKMFVHVTLNTDNIGDYIGGPVEIGRYLDEWGDETDTKAFIFSSPAYDNEGLIMLSFKDVKYEMYFNDVSEPTTYYMPYVLGFSTLNNMSSLNHFGRAEGEIWYIRKDYVSEITAKEDKNINGSLCGTRTIKFTDGFSADFYVPGTSNTNITATDFKF